MFRLKHANTAQTLKFSSVNKTQKTADLVTFAEEILSGKLHFCAV